ncbi:MAG: hypothetical protein LBK03_04575 [Bacteroidales bacterium]|jgi:hypothetical protein|nr:hypothetical protein [Bacteroidales bacterium]
MRFLVDKALTMLYQSEPVVLCAIDALEGLHVRLMQREFATNYPITVRLSLSMYWAMSRFVIAPLETLYRDNTEILVFLFDLTLEFDRQLSILKSQVSARRDTLVEHLMLK